MRLVILPDYQALSRWTAEYVARRIADFGPRAERPFVLGLPTGSTPEGMYAQLVALHRAGKLSFQNVVTFNMDEYVNISRRHPQSYHAYMQQHLFSQVDIDPACAHLLDGNTADLEQECREYEERIEAHGGVELFLGGLGHDGHIAFNEPGSSLASRTRRVTLTDETVRANARFFDGDLNQVPRQALTVGVGTVMDAREVLLMVSGAGKARALRHIVEEGVNHMWTGSALQLHPQGTIVCDEDATLELKVGTVQYFKEIEESGE